MGVLMACIILVLWTGHLLFSLFGVEADFLSPWFYLHIFIQAYLFTGLFITGHDAMHGTVSRNRGINNFFGHLATTLFAFLSFNRLKKKHYLHHRFPGTSDDPDFSPHSNNFFVWWFVFMKNYVTWWQILLMAVTFNVLLIWFTELQIIAFWVLPAILATLQLFFFGTYLPHRRPHSPDMQPHNSRTLPRNHLWAMISCYFFGYHREHHDFPTIPWWKLYQKKNPTSL